MIQGEFCYNHIDCIPLGDIGETYCALVQLSPQVDFVYRITVDEKHFETDSRMIKEMLEGVPVTAPERG